MVLGLDDDPHLAHMRMADDLVAGLHRGAGHADRRQPFEPFRSRPREQRLLGQLQPRVNVLLAQCRGLEPLIILEPFGPPGRLRSRPGPR